MKELKNKAEDLMNKAVNSLKIDLSTISTGRANPALLDMIKVENYGMISPLNQVCSIGVSDSSTLSLQVWDKSMVNIISKAINESNLGFNPSVEGQNIRISIPRLSEERRKELSKLAKKYGEDKKIVIRNIRRDILEDSKKIKESISEDDLKKFSKEVQDLTDQSIAKLDSMISEKEKDIMDNK